jgi:oligopeptidase B
MLERPTPPQEPRAEKRPVTATWHGVTLTDEFAWLKAENWQEVLRDPSKLNPDIRAHLQAENDHAAHVLADTARLQERLFAEMKGRIKQDDSTPPSPDGPFAYFARYREGGQHPLICRQPRLGGTDEILLDGDALASGLAFFALGGTRHSPDHRLLAWASDQSGAEYYTIRIRDLETGVDLVDAVPETAGSAAVWTADGQAFYYVKLDRNHRPSRVFRHVVGTPINEDALVFEEPDPGFFVTISRLQSGGFAEISAHDHETTESWLLDLARADAAPSLVAARETGVQYEVEHHPDLFGGPALVIRTNADGAEDFKIAWAPLASPARSQWRDIIPVRPGIYLLSMIVLRDWLIRLERQDGLPRLVIRPHAADDEHAVAFDEDAYSLGVEAGFEFATDTTRFAYSSMTTPTEIWDYDLVKRTRVLRKRQEIPSGHDPAQYATQRLFARAPDGETVPISILYRKDTPRRSGAPCLLYGYGAYAFAIPAAFNTNRLSLVDRGFVYALAHVRGGTEKGWRWYREGKLANKRTTFTDFIAAAEHLIAEQWTARNRIVAHGGSAGGMLMGAIANMRPDLFGAIVAEVPFVDVLNTMLDASLPLTPPEWPEWGNPIADPEAFATILGYSPYENVSAQTYPPILAMAGITDPRVLYWEPAKWVARLRDRRTGYDPLVLRINMEAGHAGAAGRFDRLKEVALAYAFAVKAMGGELEADERLPSSSQSV